MKIALSVLLFVFSFSLSAQQHLIGIKGGILSSGVNNLTGNHSLLAITDNLNSYSVGISYDFILKNKITFGIGVSYSEKGFSNGMCHQPIDCFPKYICYTSYNLTNQYFSAPISVGYQFGTKTYFDIHTGAIPSLINHSRMDVRNEDGEWVGYYSESNYYRNDAELSLFLELGVGYRFNNGIRTYFSYMYQQSVNEIEWWVDENNSYIYGLSFSFGIQYEL